MGGYGWHVYRREISSAIGGREMHFFSGKEVVAREKARSIPA
jgi:hypothetical protein